MAEPTVTKGALGGRPYGMGRFFYGQRVVCRSAIKCGRTQVRRYVWEKEQQRRKEE
ncbi:MAG: hypothetical protein K2P87_13110 [Lachnospiraceae bacterium]|nr:hypothetical protein [Lachnospiraceae bacterium]